MVTISGNRGTRSGWNSQLESSRIKNLSLPTVISGSAEVPSAVDSIKGLSAREREILSLLAAGHGTDGISEQLFISPTTVRNHIERILHKLRVHSRLQAVLIWISPRIPEE